MHNKPLGVWEVFSTWQGAINGRCVGYKVKDDANSLTLNVYAMVSLISAYASYNEAAKTLEALKEAGYSANELAIVNRDHIINGEIHIKPNSKLLKAEFAAIIILGGLTGILLSSGALATIGVHVLHPPRVAMGFALGVAFGFLSGLIISLVTYVVIGRLNDAKYRDLLAHSKFLLFAGGSVEEVEYAERVARPDGLHFELSGS